MAGGRRNLGGLGVDPAPERQVDTVLVRFRVGALALAAEGDGAVAVAVGAQLDVRVGDVLVGVFFVWGCGSGW